MVSEVVEKKVYNAASNGDVTTLVQLIGEDPYLVHGVPFPCSRNLVHIAAMHGQTAIVEEVLKLNPRQAWILDSQHLSPLHIAAAEGHVEICQKLLSVAPEACWWRDCHDMNPVHIAAMKGHVEILELLLQERPSCAMERLRRGETVLHLCVKYDQLKALKVLIDKLGELVNAIDDDGETILHLAVRCNQFEIISYLVESNSVKRRTRNSMGKTVLQILDESPSNTTSSYSKIRSILLRLSPPSFDNILPKVSDTMMVVVVLIATMAFQNAVNPPGGVWQDDTSSHKAGDAVIAYTYPHVYKYLVGANTVAFISSLFTIFLIATGGPSSYIFFVKIALCCMWVSLLAIAVSYGASTMVITRNYKKTKSVYLFIAIVILVSFLTALVTMFFVFLIRFHFNWKRKLRHQEDLTTDTMPKRTLYQIFQRLETWGCFRATSIDHF